MRTWTPLELIDWTADYLTEKGFDQPRLNAEFLLAGVLNMKRLDLYLQFERPLSEPELAEFKSRLRRRVRQEPIQYIEGVAAFRELDLLVDRRVLIPRPETEILVQIVLDWARDRPDLDVLDIGTGSGAIALSLRREGPFGRIVATDISDDALDVARSNLETQLPDLTIDFRCGASYDPVANETFDVIVSNPPYIPEGVAEGLDGEVIEWEPRTALVAGADGLTVIRQVVAGASAHLRAGGLLALEIGSEQAAEVAALVSQEPSFEDAVVRRDLTGRDRFIIANASGKGSMSSRPTPERKEYRVV